ncbi:hypothetical protein D3C85_1430490 [compost metagenome]
MRQLITFNTANGEDTTLLYFTQECRFFTQRSGNGHAQYNFIHVVCQLGRRSIKIKFNLWLPIFLENMRRIWRFERDIFGVDALDLETHFVVVLF